MKFDVAIIGAGASGTLTAVQAARAGLNVGLIDAGARAARGLAYGTPYGAHLLNVPAARMSAFPDDPDHFLRWLRGRLPDAHGGTFAPRALYGDYLASLLIAAEVTRVGGSAVGLTDGWTVHLHDGRTVNARSVVLALGNLPPNDPLDLGGNTPPEYIRDPWAPGASLGLDHDAPVLLIGTGLTALDIAIALRHDGHRGTIYALSRNGRLPQPHAPVTPRPLESVPFTTPHEGLRWMRKQEDWRAAIDSLRPHTSAIWRSWTLAQRGSFLRHMRNLWDVHRHRYAPEMDVHLTVLRGRIVSMEEGLIVRFRPTGKDDVRELRVARAINCTGPACDYTRIDLPLVEQMRRAGWLTPDALRLGIETDVDGRLISHDGVVVPGLFTLGPLRRPALWESTAIPEIRAQAAALASKL
ncbi:MAG TPA: FAD/NAD(P)-binding protein [Thermoanaerobaculia bacterium]